MCLPAPRTATHADAAGREGGGDGGLVSEDAMRRLRDTTELDYLTHVVFRMYENKRCAPAGPSSASKARQDSASVTPPNTPIPALHAWMA
jgi:hypothetical protein